MRRSIGVLAAGLAASAAWAQATGIRPGQWETTSVVTEATIPGAPPGIAALMKRPHTVRTCVTPEQAAQGPRDMLKRDKSCAVDHYTMTGGVLDAQMSCHGTRMAMHGSFTPTRYSAQSRVSGADGMTMTVAVSGRLVGPCS